MSPLLPPAARLLAAARAYQPQLPVPLVLQYAAARAARPEAWATIATVCALVNRRGG